MFSYYDLLNKLNELSTLGTKVEDGWSSLAIFGSYNQKFFSNLEEIYDILSSLGIPSLLTVRIDGVITQVEEVSDYAQTKHSFRDWELRVNKSQIVGRLREGFYFNIFLTAENCAKWLCNVNPIDKQNPLLKDAPVKVIIYDLERPFGGSHIYFLPCNIQFDSLTNAYPVFSLPNFTTVKENVHFITNFEFLLDPRIFSLCEGDYSTDLAKILLEKNSMAISLCVVNEFYSFDNVIIDGLKRVALKVQGTKEISLKFHQQLIELVSWIYQDKVIIRRKLFNERLTLEIASLDNLMDALILSINSSFRQAKERYNFVIIDRKDAYVKELKDLLKDLRIQSDLYAIKIRTLLSNFLRDTLAALVLIGFTIFTKFTDDIGLNKSRLLIGVFYGLGIYYLISVTLQAVTDITDVRVTAKELRYWKNVSKELIPDKEFEEHRHNSLRTRKISWNVIYSLICASYILIAIACFRYPKYFQSLLNENSRNGRSMEHKTPKLDSTQSGK